MIDEKTIQGLVNDSAAKFLAEQDAMHRTPPPTPDQEIAERLSNARFRESVGEIALLHGVRPSAIRHVVREAQTVFAFRDGAVVPTHGERDPADPLVPLSVSRWLEQLATTDGYLFAPQEGTRH